MYYLDQGSEQIEISWSHSIYSDPLVPGVIRVRTHGVRCVPQTLFYGFNVFELWHVLFAVLACSLALGCRIVKTFNYVLNNSLQALNFVVRQLGKFIISSFLG